MTARDFSNMDFPNCVWEVDFSLKVDLQRFADDFNIVYYSPIVFSAATVYFDEDPKLSLRLFSNGKVICAGVQLELDLQIACTKLAALLKTEVPPEENFTLRNIVATINCGGALDLDKLFNELKRSSSIIYSTPTSQRFQYISEINYSPELFPGMKIVIGPKRTTAILFKSGKINITGANNWDDLDDAYDRIIDVITNTGV